MWYGVGGAVGDAGVVGFGARRAGSDTAAADVGGTRTAGSLVWKGLNDRKI